MVKTAEKHSARSIYEMIRPKAYGLLLTNTTVGGDLTVKKNVQIKGVLSAPSYKTTISNISYGTTAAAHADTITLNDASANKLAICNWPTKGFRTDQNDTSGVIQLPKTSNAMIGKKFKFVFATDLSAAGMLNEGDLSGLVFKTNSSNSDVFMKGSYLNMHNFYADASNGYVGTNISNNTGASNNQFELRFGQRRHAFGAGTVIEVQCVADKKWLLEGNAHRGRAYEHIVGSGSTGKDAIGSATFGTQ